MHTENLVKMANDISAFFQSDPDRHVAVHGIADHIRRFWDPRMRKEIIRYMREGGVGLNDLAKEAIQQIDQETAAAAASSG